MPTIKLTGDWTFKQVNGQYMITYTVPENENEDRAAEEKEPEKHPEWDAVRKAVRKNPVVRFRELQPGDVFYAPSVPWALYVKLAGFKSSRLRASDTYYPYPHGGNPFAHVPLDDTDAWPDDAAVIAVHNIYDRT